MQQLNAPSVRWEWISEAWNLFTKQWSAWVLMMLVASLIYFLAVIVIYVPFIGMFAIAAPTVSQDGEISTSPIFPFLLLLFYPVFFLVIASTASWLLGGLYNAAFKQMRGEQIAVGDIFSGGRYFKRILGASLLIGIAYIFGIFLLVIPGLIVLGLTFLTIPMIVEGGRSTIDAIKESIEITKRDLVMFTIFSIALSFVASAGFLACGVGILATTPLLFLAHALAYRDCVGMPGARRQEQFAPPPPPDYRSYTPSQTPAQPPQAQPWAAPTYLNPPQSPPQTETSTNACPHCGATLARTMNFCNQCGRPLRSA